MSQIVVFEPIRSVGFAVIAAAAGDYVPIGAELARNLRIATVVNMTNADLMFSWRSSEDQFMLPAKGSYVWDFTTNKDINSQMFCINAGTILYVKNLETPTSGSVYFTAVGSQ